MLVMTVTGQRGGTGDLRGVAWRRPFTRPAADPRRRVSSNASIPRVSPVQATVQLGRQHPQQVSVAFPDLYHFFQIFTFSSASYACKACQ